MLAFPHDPHDPWSTASILNGSMKSIQVQRVETAKSEVKIRLIQSLKESHHDFWEGWNIRFRKAPAKVRKSAFCWKLLLLCTECPNSPCNRPGLLNFQVVRMLSSSQVATARGPYFRETLVYYQSRMPEMLHKATKLRLVHLFPIPDAHSFPREARLLDVKSHNDHLLDFKTVRCVAIMLETICE